MKMLRGVSIVGLVMCAVICYGLGSIDVLRRYWMNKEFSRMLQKKCIVSSDVEWVFPQTVEQVKDCCTKAETRARGVLAAMATIGPTERTFVNTMMRYDEAQSSIQMAYACCEALEMVSPDAALRAACHESQGCLKSFIVDHIQTPDVYRMIEEYWQRGVDREILSPAQRYFCTELLEDLQREGLQLTGAPAQRLKELKKEENVLALSFNSAIARDVKTIEVDPQDLEGVSPSVCAALEKTEQGRVIVGTDYPTFHEVMQHCHNRSVREALYVAFNNRAYPENYATLADLIDVRHDIADLMGYHQFADLNVASCMARDVATIESFLDDLAQRGALKAEREIKTLLDYGLPAGIDLAPSGKMYPWDVAFLKERYKKDRLQIDDRDVAAYFPVDRVLEGVFNLYQTFLGLDFACVKPDWVWHDEVKVIEVCDREDHAVRGYIYLDLYPRANKFTHACHIGIVPALLQKDPATGTSTRTPSLAVVVTNFPPATKDAPALLTFSDVETFLHEFGHAMHFLLGATEIASCAGTSVKMDFVEMPSQMFEEWMYDRSVIRSLSGHYVTHEPLPDELIDRLIALKTFDSWSFIVRQVMLAKTALNMYKAGKQKNIDALYRAIVDQHAHHVEYDSRAHFIASFGHLAGYDARYYCYLWSKVFALDLFAEIKTHGVTNPDIGRRFATTVLAHGGSLPPEQLLHNFLGRAPSSNAFFKDLGIV